MATPMLLIVLVLAALHLCPTSSSLYTKRYRLRRASGANATVFNHVYNIRMPRCESCAADIAVPTATMQEVRGETTQQQLYEHTLEGEQQMVFTHRINIPPQACGCPSSDILQTLLSRLEALEAQVAAFKDQCPGGTCCAATQAGNGQTDIQGLCNGHGKFDFSKCSCECEKGWGGPTCSESTCPDNCSGRGKCVDGDCLCREGFTGESCELIACKDDCNDQGRCVKGKCVCFPGYTGPTCGAMSCPENCRGHGRCVKEACVCDLGFTGPDCGSKACPENCRDRGKCINGTCVCNAGFVGPDCSTSSCPENCNNRGKCVDGKCICSTGYMGPNCSSRSCPENCKNRGQCINGKCICNPGFAGPACGARACPENCHNHGQCVNGKCVCNPGYSGPSCSSRTCPDNCNRRGLCEDGKCVCSEGFTGPNCGIRTCPENCRDRGQCEDGKCVCQAGFTGLSCEIKTCPENCKNRGRCEDGRCICEAGFTGPNCGTKTCPDNCNNRGQCEDGRCICVEGYSGPNCEVKTCPDNCKNRGQCEDGQCVCDEGYTGLDCGTKKCPNNCNSHGQCVDGQCICQAGFTGPNCGTRACPNNCNNRGRCDNGKCVCDEGYAGPICGLKICLNNCNNRGRCQKGTCICRRGYTGPDCGEMTCPGQCQGRGLCVDGSCQCQVGFGGPDCSERTCPNACSQHGKCIDGECMCQEGFSGEDCSTEVPTVQGLRVKSRQETWVIMEWERPQIAVDGYEISFRPTKEEDGVLSSRLRSTITAFNRTGLAPGVEYLVTIRTQKDQTLGPETTQTITTSIDGPKNLRVTEKTQSTITLRWDKPAARIDRYLVTYVSSAGVPRQVIVPASAREVVTLTDLDSGAEYTLVVIAERGSESSIPATTTATTAAADGASGPEQRPSPTSDVEEGAAGQGRVIQKMSPSTTTPKVQVTARIGGERSNQGESLSQRLLFIDGERVVTTVIAGEPHKKVLLLNRQSSTSEEERMDTKVVAKGGPKKLEPPKGWPNHNKEERESVAVGTTQEPNKSSVPNIRPVIIKKGKVLTTVITRGHTKEVPTNERPSLTKEARFDTSVLTGEEVPRVVTSSGRPSLSKDDRVVTNTLTREGTIQVVSPGGRHIVTKEERVISTVITEEKFKNVGSIEEKSTKLTPVKKTSGTREDSVITSLHGSEGSKKISTTNERQPLSKDRKVVATVITRLQTPTGMPPKKSPPPLTKKEQILTTAIPKEGTKKVVLTDTKIQVTKEGKNVLTGKDISPTKRPVIRIPSVTPVQESNVKGKRVVPTVITRSQQQNEVPPTKTPSVPKQDKVTASTTTKDRVKTIVSTDRKPLTTEERAAAAVVPGKSLPKGASPDKKPFLTTKEGVEKTLSAEDSQKVKLVDKKTLYSSEETAVVLTSAKVHGSKLAPVDGKTKGTKDETGLAGTKVAEKIDKTLPPGKKPTATKERVVISTVTKKGLTRASSSDEKIPPTYETVKTTATAKVTEKKVSVADKKPLYGKEEKISTKAETDEQHPLLKKTSSVDQDAKSAKPTKPEKKLVGGKDASVSKILKGHANQTLTGKVRTSLLPKSDILLENVIQNISAKLSPFNGTLLQRLESYLRVTSYPLRQNQTIKTVAKAIFQYLVSKKPPNVREIVYDRLAEKTPLEVTLSFPRPTLPSDRVKVQDSRGISSILTEQDLDSDDKNTKETSAKIQKKYTVIGQQVRHPTSEPRKENVSSRSREFSPTLKPPNRTTKQKYPNRTTTDYQKHARPYVVSHTSTSITVSLDGLKGHSNNVVIYYRDIQADFKGQRLVFPGDADVAKIPDLSPGTTYRIDLHGVFKGQSSKSYSIVTSTAPDSGQLSTTSDVSPTPWVGGGDSTEEPPSILYEPLGDLSVTDHSSDSLTLSWKADPGAFDHFAIRYKDSVTLAEVLVPGDQRTTELKPLRPGSEYEIQLQGVSEGLRTEPITINATTASRKPLESPSLMGGLTVTNITQDSFNIVWKARKGVFDSFLVRYEDVGGWLGSQEISVPGDLRATAIKDLDSGTEYTLSLYGIRKGQLSRALKTNVTTASAKGDGMPSRVEHLSTSDVQKDSVHLSWTVHDGDFDFFLIQYRDADGQTQKLTIRGDKTSVIVPGLQASTNYTFILYGISDDKESEPILVDLMTAPSPPRLGDLAASDVTEDSLRLSWNVQDGKFDSFILQYRDSQGRSETLPFESDLHTVTVSGLHPAEAYTFELYGISSNKQSEPIEVVAKTASTDQDVSRMGALSASNVTGESIQLSWTAPGGDFDSFLITYRDAEGNPQKLHVDGGLRSTTVTGLTPSKKYKFNLHGVSGDKEAKPISTEVTTAAATKAMKLPRLGDLKISNISWNSLQLSWTVPGGAFDSFLILYRDTEGKAQELPVSGDLRITTVSGLKPSKKYKFLLHGISGAKRSKPVTAEATTAAAAGKATTNQPRLGDLTISNITQNSLRLSWTVLDGAFDSFLILYRDTEGRPQELPVPGDLRIATISGLKPSKKYKFLLHGISGAKRSKPMTAEATTAAPPKKTVDRLPKLGDLSISEIQKDTLKLSWTVTNGDFDSFLILYKDSEGTSQELTIDGDLRATTVKGLKPSKKYKFALYGVSDDRRGQPISAEAITATTKDPLTPSPRLGNLTVSEVTKDSLRLSWTLHSRGYDTFLIIYKNAEGLPRGVPLQGDQRTALVAGLAPSTNYTFLLFGVTGRNRSVPISASATTESDQAVPPLRILEDLFVSNITKDSLQLSWAVGAGAFDSFLIQYRDPEGKPQELLVDGDQHTAKVSGLVPSEKYTFYLQGITGTDRVGPISTDTVTESDQAVPPLRILEDLFVSNITKDSLQLSWAVGAGDFDSFLIQYRDPEGKPQELLVDGDQHTTKVSGLVPSEKYTFYLQGITGTDPVGPISTDAVTASSEKPIAQQGRLGDLSVSGITRDSLRLSWTISVGDFDSFLIQYRDAEGKVQELPVNGDLRIATISGLRPSKKYKFILYGMSGNRRSKSISTEATTAPLEKTPTRPPRLGDLSVSDITKDSLQLSWDVEDGTFGSFLIQYKDAEGVLRELTVDGDFRTARIVGLKPAKKYKFSLYGIYGDRRTKAASTEAITAQPEKAVSHSPRLGEFFVSDITKDSLQLAWTVEDGDFDSFVIQFRDADGQTQELVVDGDIHTTTVAGLLPSRKYKFHLYGLSSNKRSKPLSTDATTAFPEAVGQKAAMLDDLYLSDVGPYTAQLSWVASEGAFDSFLIQYVDSQAVTPPREMVLEGDLRTAQIGSLQPNTEYTFTLTGLQRGQKRADLNTVGRTSRLDLEPPRDLLFRNIQETSVMVSWTPPTTSVDTFKVSYQLADGGEPQSITVDGKSSKVPLKGLTPGNRYEVNVMSIRGFQESEPLTGYVTTVPDGPTDLRATNVTETSALLLWRPALASVDTYVITYSAQNVPAITKTLSGNIAELQINGLKINTEYTAQIHSAKGSNRSSPATTTFTTSADAPRDLTASRISPRSAVLSWTPPQAMPTGYILTYEAPSGDTKEIKLDASANSYRLIDLIPSSQYRARLQALRGRIRTAPTSTMFTTARLRYPFPKDCAEERLNGASRSQPVTLYLNGDNSRPVRVFCDMETDGGGWLVFQRRMNGKTNFWRNWADYSKGFGNLTQEFWLGNENLHKLTSQDTYELRVDLRTKNESAYALYDSFRVDTEANYYRLRIGKYSGNAGDSLSYHNNMIFSTRDRDRNKHIMPCAISYRGAWWYKNCHYVNLNGLYGNNKDHQGVNWYSWKGFEFSIPFTEMKMRPKNTVALRKI